MLVLAEEIQYVVIPQLSKTVVGKVKSPPHNLIA